MRKVKKPVFFIVVICIAAFAYLTFAGVHTYYGDIRTDYIKGVDTIRWGIDIQGGVNATFQPADSYKASHDEMDAAKAVIEQRLVSMNVTDSEVYVDYNNYKVIVSFPWQADEEDFDPEVAVSELGETAKLTFRKGDEYDTDAEGNITPTGDIVINGSDIDSAGYTQQPDASGNYEWVVTLKLNTDGTSKFGSATSELAGTSTPISIWMDSTMISAPTVNNAITNGNAVITGNFTSESAKKLADQINSGALPFKIETKSFKTISPTMGEGSLDAILLAAVIAFALIAIYMIVLYRVPGLVAVIAICGQIAGSLAAVTGWFGFQPGATLTIPGIAGIILAVGMGVDANIITGERIKEELRSGKTLDGAIKVAYKRAFSAILDGNITNVLIAVILMGAFGVPSSFFSKILNKTIFFMFGATAEGFVYSFGFTLLAGVILNFVMGVFASRLMVTSLSKFKCFKNRKLYGGDEK